MEKLFSESEMQSMKIPSIWKSISEYDENLYGQEVIGFNEEWIEPDYNPNGQRICCLIVVGGDNFDPENWVSAKWCNTHDCYENKENTIPTHFLFIPEFDIKN